jgi:hypothetical protein
MTIIEPILEVTLMGEANFDVWKPILDAQGFDNYPQSEKIGVTLSGVEAKYMGLTFREFSISVTLNESELFLAHAYNSKRFFALAERRFFRTPYYPADITVTAHKIAVYQNKVPMIEAILPQNAPITHQADESVEWTLWLPKALRKNPMIPHYFDARLEGNTQHYDITSAQITLSSNPPDAVMALLSHSQFVPKDWFVRAHGRHSKSKTHVKK